MAKIIGVQREGDFIRPIYLSITHRSRLIRESTIESSLFSTNNDNDNASPW